jgi:hypothetical protein
MFPHFARPLALVAAALALSAPAVRAAETGAAGALDGAWQHHHVTFDYFGETTLFTCDGLEGQVTQILRYLGARKDIKVHATGCPGPLDRPSHMAWVDVDFYSLAPSDAATAGTTVKAQWSAALLTPRQPSFSSEGHCELMQSMKDTILKNFSLRGFDYRTSCVPHSLSPNGFEIKGDVLKPVLVKTS